MPLATLPPNRSLDMNITYIRAARREVLYNQEGKKNNPASFNHKNRHLNFFFKETTKKKRSMAKAAGDNDDVAILFPWIFNQDNFASCAMF